MPRESLKNLLEMYPWFFDKSVTSNFHKSVEVTNRRFQDLYQSLFEVANSIPLGKRCLIWKEQSVPYDYQINFVANFPHLKSVNCYKNDEIIYSEHYNYEDNVDSFVYIYDSSMDTAITEDPTSEDEEENIIPSDKFKIIVETFDEYLIQKGFPENDEILGDEYDHDISLDEIGAQNNIPRKTYIETDDYAHTEPPYNNRLSEDDYHYMNRIINYLLRIHDTPLPVLEVWKLYGIFADLSNRDQYLLHMYDEKLHPDYDWTPQPWEYNDTLCDLQPDDGEFFFVSANTLLPIKNQVVKFNFKFINSLTEPLTGDYNVSIILNDEPLVNKFTGSQYIVPNNVIHDDEPNIFTFLAYAGDRLITTEELIVNVRGCTTADWYVSPNGADTNDGKSNQTPFQSISKALSMVNGEENLIVLMSGTHNINQILPVTYSCTLLGCGDPVINSTNSLKFFNVLQNQELLIQDVTLKHDTNEALVEDTLYQNNNLNYNGFYVVLREATKILTLIEVDTDKSSYVVGNTVIVTGTLTDEQSAGLSGKSIKIYVNNELVDTVTTANNTGTFTKQITATTDGNMVIRAVFEGDNDYYSSTSSVTVPVSAKPLPDSISIAAEKPIMSKGENNKITATVLDSDGNPCVGETVSFSVVDGEDLGTAVTDASGEAFVYYLGKGTNLLNIKCFLGVLSDETQIMDYYYYGIDKYTTQNNLILSEIPSNFECSFILRVSNSTSNNTGILSSTLNNGDLLVGNISSSNPQIALYPTTSTGSAQYMGINKNVETELTWKYENGVHTVTDGTNTISLTGYAPSDLKCSATSNCYIKNIIVKKL